MKNDAPILFNFDPKDEPTEEDLFLTSRWETALITVIAVALLWVAFWLGRWSVEWWQ